jgi:hypothetical protein
MSPFASFRTRVLWPASCLLLAFVVCPAQQARQQGPKVRVTPRVSAVRPPELTRSPDDKVWVNDEGDLVIEGARGKSGEPVPFTITRRVHVRPEVLCRVRREGDGFKYEYAFANAQGARQWIQIFWLDALAQVAVARAPASWRVFNIERSKPPVERVFFGRDAADNDTHRRLTAGMSHDGFAVVSPARPGLVRMYFVGHKPIPGASGAVSDEARLNSPEISMSDWLRQEVNRHLSLDANAVPVFTLGPKVPAGVPEVQAIRGELLDALRNPLFTPDRAAIETLLRYEDRVTLRTGVQELLANASGLRSTLYSAILEHY